MSGGRHLSVSVEMHKIDGDPAATDGQVTDAPARPMMKENAASNRRYQHLPPEVAGGRHVAINNSDETSEELHAEEELQGDPGPPAQKSALSKIKPTIPVDNDDSSLADTWGDYNFPKGGAGDGARRHGGQLERRAGRREPESGELGSESEDKVLEEEQEMEKRTCTKPKNSRKGDIDGAEAEQSKAAR